MSQIAVQWIVKRGFEKSWAEGHPWVFSNALAHSPKGLEAGALVDLVDHRGQFLARGYGHPNSLIAFRALSRQVGRAVDAEFFRLQLQRAFSLRTTCGLGDYSHRACFAEADGLPGLIIDRYLTVRGEQIFVVQSSTAGMEKLLPFVWQALETFSQDRPTAWVESPDSKARALEGLAVEDKRCVREIPGLDLENLEILAEPAQPGLAPVRFHVDFLGGQKTGFFLDQRGNLALAARLLPTRPRVRVLDLCCYVGQWGTQMAHVLRARGQDVEVTFVDASASALALAQKNLQTLSGVTVETKKMDVLSDLGAIANGSYDVVICDPPAFIKKKKDIPAGMAAYTKLNRQALQKLAPGGLFVTCSCSGLLTDELFREVVAKASRGLSMRWVARGSHGFDHPQLPQFPQGTYLKSWVGVS